MPDYKNGKLYKLQCDDGYYYIGSTCNELRFRLYGHKTDSKDENSKKYQHINTIGWDRVRIVLVEDCPCENKQQLVRKEDMLIRSCEKDPLCLNSRRESHNRQEYYQENREHILENKKEYQQTHSQQIKERKSIYYQEHKEEIKQKDKDRYKQQKEHIIQQKKEYYKQHIDELKQRDAEHYRKNKERIRQQQQEYQQTHSQQIKERKRIQYQNKKLALTTNAYNTDKGADASGITKE
jgi:hypothetical protein